MARILPGGAAVQAEHGLGRCARLVGRSGRNMVPTDWGQLTLDGSIQGFFSMVCRGSSDDGPHLCQSADRRGVKVWIWGPLPIGELVGRVDLQVTSVHPIHLRVTSASYTYAVPVCSRPDLTRVVDLCCGLGGFTHMLDRVGLQLVCGVDQNQRWEPLFTTLHPGAKFLHGDINEPRIIRDLTEAGCFHGIMCAGISCNAHSTMGDQMGMADPRSRFCWLSLPKALQTGYMLQSACFVLECTPAIMAGQRSTGHHQTVCSCHRIQGFPVLDSVGSFLVLTS